MNQTPSGVSDVASEAFIVGDLHVDVGQQRVTRAGIAIPLPNLSFQLLLALIRVAPNILSNDLLMARVWPGMIVSPETVAKRVNLLREALGDNAQEPRYIAGVRSRGYRLIATVSSAPRPAPPDEGSLSAPVGVTQSEMSPTQDAAAIAPRTVSAKPGRIWWLALPVLLAVIVAIAISVRTANKSRVVWRSTDSSESVTRNCGNRRARAHGGRVAVRQYQRRSSRRVSGAGPAGNDTQPPVAN